MVIDQDELARLTEQYGGAWGLNHTRRLLNLVEAVWLAAHLHDWGAYASWAQPGVDHALRSRQVAEAWLAERECPAALQALVLECIELHHAPGADRSLEAILLRDADVLDFLGVVGVLRDVSKNPRDLRKAYDTICQRRAKLPALLHLEKARELAGQRLAEMDALLTRFEAESFGCF